MVQANRLVRTATSCTAILMVGCGITDTDEVVREMGILDAQRVEEWVQTAPDTVDVGESIRVSAATIAQALDRLPEPETEVAAAGDTIFVTPYDFRLISEDDIPSGAVEHPHLVDVSFDRSGWGTIVIRGTYPDNDRAERRYTITVWVR